MRLQTAASPLMQPGWVVTVVHLQRGRGQWSASSLGRVYSLMREHCRLNPQARSIPGLDAPCFEADAGVLSQRLGASGMCRDKDAKPSHILVPGNRF